MIFAIHQSKNNPRIYLFTKEKGNISGVPEGVIEHLGKIQFLRNSREQSKETEIIALRYKEIEAKIISDGYCLLKL
ncbi:YcgL domain-containing protein [Desulfovibrio sp. TomC]|uniref:YcgL domain-containing protein n=1 Tax=Desulfovibrio sp. TomC TaxID=1562888 RepID=UPI0005754D8F|nr:YcgL domain-containing protein [Desulfovibrio sp. TomC]KHK01667.1 hypothetical protein NY78_2967 [Desulfovibrio sp. TomC]